MRVVLFGCKDTTLHVAKAFAQQAIKPVLVTISPEKGETQQVAGYTDLSAFPELFTDIYVANRYDLKSEQDLRFFQSGRFEVGFAIGWQRLVPADVLALFSIGVFGMHGSAQDLPYGRGRSPMNWSILEGRRWFYTNLFKYHSGVDDGPILDTECFSIQDSDTCETLHYKNTITMIHLIRRNWERFLSGELSLRNQKQGAGSAYPKRSPEDGLIDWRDTVFNLEKLVRAVTKPFDGAFSYLGTSKVKIYRATIFYTDIEAHPFRPLSAGMICDVFPNGKFLVRCNGGVLLVHDFDTEKNEISPGEQFVSPEEELRLFPRNRFGFFDC